jgi:hypothetical protein
MLCDTIQHRNSQPKSSRRSDEGTILKLSVRIWMQTNGPKPLQSFEHPPSALVCPGERNCVFIGQELSAPHFFPNDDVMPRWQIRQPILFEPTQQQRRSAAKRPIERRLALR